MSKLRNTIIGMGMMVSASAANAVVIDFNAMAEATGGYGESAWTSLGFSFTNFDLSITGIKDGKNAFAYLDSNNGGLGVCGAVYDFSKANKKTGSGNNLCNKSNDDNMTVGESLSFVFSEDVIIEQILFNNNHDSDQSLLGDKINIDGSEYLFNNGGPLQDSYTTSPYLVSAGTSFDIAYNDEAFYVSAIEVSAVPTPSAVALMGIGLMGFIVVHRKSNRCKVIV